MSAAVTRDADGQHSPGNSITARRRHDRLMDEALAAVVRRSEIAGEELREAYRWPEQPLGRTDGRVGYRAIRSGIMQRGWALG